MLREHEVVFADDQWTPFARHQVCLVQRVVGRVLVRVDLNRASRVQVLYVAVVLQLPMLPVLLQFEIESTFARC